MAFLSKKLNDISYEEFIQTLHITATLKSPSLLPYLVPFLADGFAHVERLDLKVTEVLMNLCTYANYRRQISSDPGLKIFKIETDAKKLEQGIIAYIWGATIILNEKIPENTILVLSGEHSEYEVATILHLEKGPEKPKEFKRFDNSDIVITLKSKNGKLSVPNTCVYVKENGDFSQVGLIQGLYLGANMEIVELGINFPSEISETSKENLNKNIKLLTEKGCFIKKQNIKTK